MIDGDRVGFGKGEVEAAGTKLIMRALVQEDRRGSIIFVVSVHRVEGIISSVQSFKYSYAVLIRSHVDNLFGVRADDRVVVRRFFTRRPVRGLYVHGPVGGSGARRHGHLHGINDDKLGFGEEDGVHYRATVVP